MTEKRFVGNFQGKMLVSIRDKKNNCNVNILQIVEIANELSNENEQLKKDNEHIETCFKMAHSTYHMLQKQYHNRESAISKYRKENERLKKENNKLKHSTGIEGLKMAGKILIELKSYRDDEKFVEVESDEEMSLEEAVDCVIEYWADMGATYYSWDCKKIIFE